MDSSALLVELALLYVVAPIWILAGLADFSCHRAMRIEETAGVRESLLHLAMLAQIGVAAASPLLLQPTAAVLVMMLLACLAHEATTCVDLAYAASTRPIPWFEQWVHGLQQALPWAWLAGWSLVAAPQVLALLGLADGTPDWGLRPRRPRLSTGYPSGFFGGAGLLVVAPFCYEWWRCRQARHCGHQPEGFSRPS